MKKLFYLLMSLILVACGSEKTASISSGTSKDDSTVKMSAQSIETGSVKMSAQSIISQMEKGQYKEGELLVKFKSGVVKASAQKVHQAVRASVIKSSVIIPTLEHVKLPEGLSVKDAVAQYMSDPNVEYAEPNYMRCLSKIPNDIYFGNQWALNNDGTYAGGTANADIDAAETWEITTGSSNVIIAVLDSGIDYNHQDLVGNIWKNTGETNCMDGVNDDGNGFIDDCKGWDFANNDNDPMDDLGHGTHVAGIIGAKGDNGIGISGMMWNVQLMPLKIYNADTELTGSCSSVFVADEVEAIYYAVNMGAKVINASFHGEGYCNSELNAITYANSKGVLFVAAAGNGGDDGIGDNNDIDPQYPASYNLPNIISVAATDQDDRRVSFSNYGPNSVHVAAPGVYIISTLPNSLSSSNGYGYLEFYQGTSIAAPHVAGLAGLLYSYYDGSHNTLFNYTQVRDTILRYVDKEPSLDGWIKTGGRINAYRALSSLLTPTNLTANALGPTKISLVWEDRATGEDGYVVERITDGAKFTLPSDSSSFTDTSVIPSTTYTYKVKAFNNISESFYSNDATVTTPAKKHDGGGGCSIGAKQNTPTAIADLGVLLIPLIFIALMRRRR